MRPYADSELKNLMESIKEVLPDFPVSMKDLKFPKSQFMINYFTSVLEDFGKHVPKAQSHLQFDSKYHEVTGSFFPLTVKLLFAVKAFFPNNLGLLDTMSLETLTDPQPSDIQYIIAMNNFHSFAANRISTDSENTESREFQASLTDMAELVEKRNELENRIAQHDEDHRLAKNRMAECIENIPKLSEKVISLRQKLTKEQIDDKDLEQVESRMFHELEKLKEKRAAVEQQHKQLSGVIVQSPERILMNKHELEEKVIELQKVLDESSTIIKLVKKSMKDMTTGGSLLSRIVEELDIILSDCMKIETADAASIVKNREEKEKCEKVTSMKEKLHNKEKEIENYKSQVVVPQEEKIQFIKKQQETVKSNVDCDFSARESKILALSKQYQAMETKHLGALEDFNKKKQHIYDKCNELVEETRRDWDQIIEKEREELRILKEASEKELERLGSFIDE